MNFPFWWCTRTRNRGESARTVPEAKIKVTDMLVVVQHQEPVTQNVIASVTPEAESWTIWWTSLSAETSSHQRATTMQMIQKTDEFRRNDSHS